MSHASDSSKADSGQQALTATLRLVASRAAELAGRALVFAHGPHAVPGGKPPALRAAAGFDTPDEARVVAGAVAGIMRDCFESSLDTEDESDETGHVWASPIAIDGRHWGVLIAVGRNPIDGTQQQALASLADGAALHTDHAWLCNQLAGSETAAAPEGDEEEDSDELLKLSEALFAQDIELLESEEKLSSVEKLKNDFIEKMSRELRTPLNSIIEAIISVLAGENEALSDHSKTNLRAALDDGTAFLRTLQNILDLWRIKQGELPVEVQEVNFREVVEEAIFSVQDTLGDKPVVVEKCYVEPLPKIRTDLAKINQVLFLVLDNACKFTAEGTVEIEASVRNGLLRCQITDSGIGICADDREYIFDDFFQVDETAEATYRGAGLGLTLVRELLTLMDGDIEITSEVGHGTTVVFEIPVQTL